MQTSKLVRLTAVSAITALALTACSDSGSSDSANTDSSAASESADGNGPDAERAGMAESLMWLVLMVYGIGNVAGNYFGGWLADRSLEKGILFSLITITLILVAFFFTSHNPILGTINFGLIGFFGASLTPSLQIRLMDVAGDAQTLAASLNHSALNLANAAGAAIGGVVVGAGMGYASPALAGAALSAVAILIWIGAQFVKK